MENGYRVVGRQGTCGSLAPNRALRESGEDPAHTDAARFVNTIRGPATTFPKDQETGGVHSVLLLVQRAKPCNGNIQIALPTALFHLSG